MTPRILIIAGSDSGGGAGVQADIKTVTMLGGHAMTAITAITAQNTLGVQAVMPVPTEMVLAQIESCVSDIGVDAVKIGMLGSAETARAVADWLVTNQAPVVFDPVMVATSGDVLADADTLAAMHEVRTWASITTPNRAELEALGGLDALIADGECVLAKGGHDDGDTVTDRLVHPDGELGRWSAPRIPTSSTHGTGCTLASAIATFLAEGRSLRASIVRARQFVRLALHDAPGLGGGQGPMGHQKVRLDLGPELRLNQITLPLDPASTDFYRALGLRQIVATEDGHYARFEAPGGATLSVEREAQPTVFFECNDLDAEVARLQSAGLVFDQLPIEQPWLWREARLTDPAGEHDLPVPGR